MDTTNDDYDNPWKSAIERYLGEFLAIFCPWLEAAIDWSVAAEFHDQELRQVSRAAKTGLRMLDKLAKVRLLDGRDLYIHLEVQLCRQRGFGRRMFTYNARLFDRYGCAVASIAVLADRCSVWRPCDFWCEAGGTRLGIEFTTVKLLDFYPLPSGQECNFFALLTEAHFSTLRTKRKPDERLASKLKLTEAIYRLGWPERRVLDFHNVIDWMMYLPEQQMAIFKAALAVMERRFKMPYVNSMIRDAIEEGRAKGLAEGRAKGLAEGCEDGRRRMLAEMLELRFGRLPDAAKGRLARATPDELSRWARAAFDANSLDDVLGD